MALITTPGADDANSYIDVAYADAYFAEHWSAAKTSAWDTLGTDAQKENVLKAAARVIDTLRFHDVPYAGITYLPAALDTRSDEPLVSRYSVDQALAFPRNIDVDGVTPFVPDAVKEAQCEQAVFLLSVDESAIATQLSGVMEEAIAAGGARVYTQFSHRGSLVAPMALEFLKPFIRKAKRLRRA